MLGNYIIQKVWPVFLLGKKLFLLSKLTINVFLENNIICKLQLEYNKLVVSSFLLIKSRLFFTWKTIVVL
jgi:hypothetical protein